MESKILSYFHWNGQALSKKWAITGMNNETIYEGHGPQNMRRHNFFQWMFPSKHLMKIVDAINRKISSEGRKTTYGGEVLRFFGLLLIIMGVEFADLLSLWSEKFKSENISLWDSVPSCYAIDLRSSPTFCISLDLSVLTTETDGLTWTGSWRQLIIIWY